MVAFYKNKLGLPRKTSTNTTQKKQNVFDRKRLNDVNTSAFRIKIVHAVWDFWSDCGGLAN